MKIFPNMYHPHRYLVFFILLCIFCYETIHAQVTDGKIVFAFFSSDSSSEIYTIKTIGQDLVQLTNNLSRDFSPTWSPNGTKIAFISDRDGANAVYLMNPDGTAAITVPDTIGAQSVDWSSTRNQLLIHTIDEITGEEGIYSIRLDGTQKTLIISDGTFVTPVWSPNGSSITFGIMQFDEGRPSLYPRIEAYSINIGSPTETKLFDGGPGLAFFEWYDANTMIYQIGATSKKIERVNLLTNERMVLVEGTALSLSPDAMKLAYVKDLRFINILDLSNNSEATVTSIGTGNGFILSMDWQPIPEIEVEPTEVTVEATEEPTDTLTPTPTQISPPKKSNC